MRIGGLLMVAGVLVGSAVGQAAKVSTLGGEFRLGDGAVALAGSVSGGHLVGLRFSDGEDRKSLVLQHPFAVVMVGGQVVGPESLTVVGGLKRFNLPVDAGASRAVERIPGRGVAIDMVSSDGKMKVRWEAVLRDGSAYLRQRVTITAVGTELAMKRVLLWNIKHPGAAVLGKVKGSPVVAGDLFLGLEHPLAESEVVDGQVKEWIGRQLPLAAGVSVSYSSVIGVVQDGQLRRDFLTYLERERAHPYRTFLHYNSWYDLGYFTPYEAAGAVDRVEAFGRELHEKRGVVLDSYLFDDGWDDHASLWGFNKGFPDGFTPVKVAAEKYGAEIGVWMSPWGGYAGPKKERIAFGRKAGYEIVDDGYALSGERYFAGFRAVCLEMMAKFGVNQFKFDGTGNADTVFPGSKFDSDFGAALALIGDLRKAKPDLYVNLTTGTTPSPFWLLYADSIWRGGEDDDFAGVGTDRERWITYRDGDTYEGIVQQGPLYPLNSLMLHGIIYAEHNRRLKTDAGGDFRNEVRSYFGTGTQLQEMYITPGLLTAENWDDLAEAAKWSRANADVLKDSHWVGGDPKKLEVYGWASWASRKGILTLRNPSDKPQGISVDVGKVFELPVEAARRFVGTSPWKSDAGHTPLRMEAGQPVRIELKPFEVLTLDCLPL